MLVPFTIDASAAIGKLGIRIPVRFQAKRLNKVMNSRTGETSFDPVFVYSVLGSLSSGQTDLNHLPDYAVVNIDWEALATLIAYEGMLPQFQPECVIAHELIHVQQQQGCPNGKVADEQYARFGTVKDGHRVYKANPYEADAFAREREIAPYIKLTPTEEMSA